jgi:hypothetical protein
MSYLSTFQLAEEGLDLGQGLASRLGYSQPGEDCQVEPSLGLGMNQIKKRIYTHYIHTLYTVL